MDPWTETLAMLEGALSDLRRRRAWGHVVIHFERGRVVSITLDETRKLLVKAGTVAPEPEEQEPAA